MVSGESACLPHDFHNDSHGREGIDAAERCKRGGESSGRSSRGLVGDAWLSRPRAEKFYKGGSQEETLLLRPEFFLLPSPPDRARSALSGRAMDSGAGHCGPAVWI